MIEIVSFDGFDLNDSVYSSGFPEDSTPFVRTAAVDLNPVTGRRHRFGGIEQQPSEFALEIGLRTPTTANIQALLAAFSVGKQGVLIIDVDGVQRARDCAVLGAYPYAEGTAALFVATLTAADARWRTVTQTSDAEVITATAHEWDVDNDGDAAEDTAKITIHTTTNKAATDAWTLRQRMRIGNIGRRSVGNYPFEFTNGGIDHAALTTAKSLATANDFRLLIDGVEVPRYLGEHADNDADSAAMKVWAGLSMAAGVEAFLAAAITATVPANGGDLEVADGGTADFPDSGFLTNIESDEVISYTGKTLRNANGREAFTGITRARRGTTAAIGAAADKLILDEHTYEFMYGYSGAGAPETPLASKPIVDLTVNTITNLLLRWTQYYDDDNSGRPGTWSRTLEVRRAQEQFVWMPDGAPAGALTFQYKWIEAPPDYQNYNVVRFAFPFGTDGTSGQVAFTRALDAGMMLQLLALDHSGVEAVVDEIFGPQASGAYSSLWDAKAYELAIHGRSQVVVSTPEMANLPLTGASSTVTVAAINTSGSAEQILIGDHDEPMIVVGLQVLISEPNANEIAVSAYVLADDGTGGPVAVLGQLSITTADIEAFAKWVGGLFNRPFVWMPDTDLHAYLSVAAGTHSNVIWFMQPMVYAEAYGFKGVRLLGDGQIQDTARAEDEDEATLDPLTIKIDPDGLPYYNRGAEEAAYWLDGTLTNTDTDQSITFRILKALADDIEIDLARGTVRNLGTGESVNYRCVDFSDEAKRFTLLPGTNTLRWDEVGVASVTVTIDHYDRYE